jgi:hypothetical protein
LCALELVQISGLGVAFEMDKNEMFRAYKELEERRDA